MEMEGRGVERVRGCRGARGKALEDGIGALLRGLRGTLLVTVND